MIALLVYIINSIFCLANFNAKIGLFITIFRWNTTYLDYSSHVASEIDYGKQRIALKAYQRL